jgi:dTDP-4-amino-4,6-dideoxygalactose transaminase
VIEDCAQSFMAEHRGRKVGTFGAVGCFSLQQGKHITTGEGGLVVSNDAAIARRLFLHINKAWGYGDEKPDHYFLALNYRMNEITGAVAVAQLGKLQEVAARRVASAARLTEMLEGPDQAPGLRRCPHLLEVLSDRRSRGHPGRVAGSRQRPQGLRHPIGAALHPEAVLHVPDLP